MLSSLLFSVFFAAILLATLFIEKIQRNADILVHLAPLQEQPAKVSPETALEMECLECVL